MTPGAVQHPGGGACRDSVVRATAIESVTRDESGRLSLRLKGHSEKLGVSRLYAHMFKAM